MKTKKLTEIWTQKAYLCIYSMDLKNQKKNSNKISLMTLVIYFQIFELV